MSAETANTIDDWDDFRRHMPIASRWAYFDHAAVAPLSGPADEAMRGWSLQAAAEGNTQWGHWSQRVEDVRARAASLIGAQPENVALVPNTTAGVNLVAEGFPWREGDNVVVPDLEFPTNVYPWLNLRSRGVETRRVPVDGGRVDLDRLGRACDRRTRIVSVSWVGYATGWRIDVNRLVDMARENGTLVFLDAIQGLGVFPLDLRQTPVDFLAADGHKWLLGPEGAGIFYMRGEHLDLLRPIGVGWNSVTGRYDFDHINLDIRRQAARYEGGSQNLIGFHGLGASLDLLARFGAAPNGCAIADRLLDITDRCCHRLQRAGATIVSDREKQHRSGIVAFELPGAKSEMVRQRCLDAGVVLSCRHGRLRISPHVYTNDDDIDRLVSTVQQVK